MNDSKIYRFIVFCIEHYRQFKQLTAMQSLALFRSAGAFQYLTDGYEVLHTQSKDYIVADIDDFISHHTQ